MTIIYQRKFSWRKIFFFLIFLYVLRYAVEEFNIHALLSNKHHIVNIGFNLVISNFFESLSFPSTGEKAYHARKNIINLYNKYPLFASSEVFNYESIRGIKSKERFNVVEVSNGMVYFLVSSPSQFLAISATIPYLNIDERRTTEVHTVPQPHNSVYFENMMKNNLSPGYPAVSDGFSCIRSLKGSYMTMEFLLHTYPDLVDVINIGPTYLKEIGNGGHDMQVLKISNKKSNVSKKAPFFIVCSQHARELIPAEICARFAETMIMQYGKNADITWILDFTEIHILMQANPDGREDDESKFAIRGIGHCRRKNMRREGKPCLFEDGSRFGVDINRNFPHPFWRPSPMGMKCFDSYSGTSPASEPETVNIINHIESVIPPGTNQHQDGFFANESIGLLMDLHSFGNFFVWPYAYSDQAFSFHESALKAFAYKLDSFSNEAFDLSNDLEKIGSMIDWAHEKLGISAIAVEFGSKLYESCSNFESQIMDEALGMLLYGARIAWRPYVFPLGPDVISMKLSSSTLMSNQTLQVEIKISDAARDGAAELNSMRQDIEKVHIFLDSHPYEALSTAVPIVFKFSQSPTESFSFNLSLTNLTKGQHLLYIQGEDTASLGPVFSEFFSIS